MKTQKHSTTIAQATIHRLIEALHDLFMKCRARNTELEALKAKREVLNNNNPDFAECNDDHRETMKMYGRLIVIVLSIGIDFLLLYQSISILCNQFGFPIFLRFLIPAFFIVVEILVTYFQIIKQRTGERGSWFMRNTQYFILLLLLGLSVFTILFSVQSYNKTIDGIGFIPFLTGTILFQSLLLIASILLHLWIIHHAEEIADSVAQLLYRISRNKITTAIEKIEKENRNKYMPAFAQNSQKLVQRIHAFKQEHPGTNVDFEKAMPSDLQHGINQVMGKTLFVIEPRT